MRPVFYLNSYVDRNDEDEAVGKLLDKNREIYYDCS